MLKKTGNQPNWPTDGIKPTNLFATNKEATNINSLELNKLFGKPISFLAQDKEKIIGGLDLLIKSCLAPTRLELKIGAQVMLIRNLKEKNLINGSQGIVRKFDEESKPVVKFTNGKELTINWETWERIEGYDSKNKPIISATRKQIPLILSWGITVNKSQGQSIERLRVDLKRCWMAGQVYVALSRATNPDFLQIINFSHNRLRCDPKVKKFYESLEKGEEYSNYAPVLKIKKIDIKYI